MAGDKIIGELTQRGKPMPLTLKKGEYKAPAYSLNLSPKAMDQLLGKWQAGLGPLTIIFRFEKMESGVFKGFVDSPDQDAKGIPIMEATLTDRRLEIKVKAVGSEFSGQLSGDTLSGEWTQMGRSNPLTLAKK